MSDQSHSAFKRESVIPPETILDAFPYVVDGFSPSLFMSREGIQERQVREENGHSGSILPNTLDQALHVWKAKPS